MKLPTSYLKRKVENGMINDQNSLKIRLSEWGNNLLKLFTRIIPKSDNNLKLIVILAALFMTFLLIQGGATGLGMGYWFAAVIFLITNLLSKIR